MYSKYLANKISNYLKKNSPKHLKTINANSETKKQIVMNL